MTNFIETSILWDVAFSETWVSVTDSNDCDVQVTLDDLIENQPTDNRLYEKVYYYGQAWWISKDLHFPV